MSSLFECEGASDQNFDEKFQEQLVAELLLSYPKRYRELYFVNAPMIVNTAYGLLKRHMTQNMKDTFFLGHQVDGMEGRRIDVLFKTPTPEMARQHMVNNVRQLLLARYQRQATYVLPSLDEPIQAPSPLLTLISLA